MRLLFSHGIEELKASTFESLHVPMRSALDGIAQENEQLDFRVVFPTVPTLARNKYNWACNHRRWLMSKQWIMFVQLFIIDLATNIASSSKKWICWSPIVRFGVLPGNSVKPSSPIFARLPE
jgi:hypothetical protein